MAERLTPAEAVETVETAITQIAAGMAALCMLTIMTMAGGWADLARLSLGRTDDAR